MTVLSQCCFPTNDLVIEPGRARFYGLDIPVPHPQLRCFFSTVDKDWIYYASRSDLCALHLPSQRKLLVKTLPFEPRCLAAGLGWICAGGEQNGEVAFVRLIDEEHDSRFQPGSAADGLPDSGLFRMLDGEKSRHGWVHKFFGGEIVNSITLHELSNVGRSLWNEPVALLSNNDKTVKIYSLIQQKLLADLPHPSLMNCAMISPDSELLVTVGDCDQAFVYIRKSIDLINLSAERFAKYEWEELTRLSLSCEGSYDDHSFSIAFSPSGHLCAISAQGGMISIFDVSRMAQSSEESNTHEGDGLLCAFKSFRPGLCGSIRSMSFSPRPWDLLVWAEDRGRAGMVDVRQAFCRRQALELDPHSSSLERVKLTDVTDPSIKLLDSRGRQLFQYQSERPNIRSDEDSDRSAQMASEEADPEAVLQHLTAQTEATDFIWPDPAILPNQALAVAEHADPMNPRNPYSINYRFSHQSRPAPTAESHIASHGQLRSLIDLYREFPTRPLYETLGDSYRERDPDSVLLGDRPYPPRRRNSVILSQARSLASGLSPISGPRSRITASPVRMAGDDTSFVAAGSGTSESTTESLVAPNASNVQPRPRPSDLSDSWDNVASTLENSAQLSSSLPASSAAPNPDNNHNDEVGRTLVGIVPVGQTSAATSNTLPPILNPAVSRSIPYSQITRGPSRRETHTSDLETERQLHRVGPENIEVESNPERRSVMSQLDYDNAFRLLLEQSHRRLRHERQAQDRISGRQSSLASTSVGQRPEYTGRATQAELRLAHQMMMRHRPRFATDRNGNWLGDESLEQRSGRPSLGEGDGLGGSSHTSEVGVGTTGVGWSPDGRQFYVGTEEGIFEYKINLLDRRSFPALELR